MAIEAARGCGYRKVGGLYLCGEFKWAQCDRLPIPLETCPVCGLGFKFSRGYQKFEPLQLWGEHQGCADTRGCLACDPPPGAHYLMFVGDKFYTPHSFLVEAQARGVSKRIGAVPRGLVVGETVIYLAHPKAVVRTKPPLVLQATAGAQDLVGQVLEEAEEIITEAYLDSLSPEELQPRMLDAEEVELGLGVFTAFIPQRVEMLVWKSEATAERLAALQERGITPVIIPDNDFDHRPKGH